MSNQDNSTKGWTIDHPKYGKWFISRQAVIDDWKKDHLAYYPHEGERDPSPKEVETWFDEQITWFEVQSVGEQISQPDMKKWEVLWRNNMKTDFNCLSDDDIIEVKNKPVI